MRIYYESPMDSDDDAIVLESIDGRPYIALLTMTDCDDVESLNSRCMFRCDLVSLRDAIDKLLNENFGD